MKYSFQQKHNKEKESKICVVCELKEVLIIFTTKRQSVNSALIKEVQNEFMKTKIKYRINKKIFVRQMEKKYYRNKNKWYEIYKKVT